MIFSKVPFVKNHLEERFATLIARAAVAAPPAYGVTRRGAGVYH
jgi:hypothetical protein